jgi:nucleoside-diphosphate-sugar epimerase
MDIVMLRYFTVYGPGQRPDMAMRKFVTQILENRPPIIYGDGTQMRDFTYVDDIVAGTIAAAECKGNAGEAFNLGGGHRITINDLVQRLLKLCGKEREIQPGYEPAKLGDVENTHADIAKANHALRYNPSTDLDQGLMGFTQWCAHTSRPSDLQPKH